MAENVSPNKDAQSIGVTLSQAHINEAEAADETNDSLSTQADAQSTYPQFQEAKSEPPVMVPAEMAPKAAVVLPDSPEKMGTDWGMIWDAGNTFLALLAFAASIYVSWSSNRAKDFDDEYGSRILKGCESVRDFLDRISVVANIPSQAERRREADDLFAQWNKNIHPLQNSLKYTDEHFPKNTGKGKWSDCGMALYDSIGDILGALCNTATNWKQTYDVNEQAANKQLSEIHKKIKRAREKVSGRRLGIGMLLSALVLMIAAFWWAAS